MKKNGENSAFSSRGFTIIELIVVISIGVIVSTFVFGVGAEFYGTQTFISERDTILALMRKARTNALNNVGQSDHGVFISEDNYVIFEGSSYVGRNADFDEVFPRLGGTNLSGPTEIVFSAPEGSSNVSGTISVFNSRGAANISVNYEGRISW